MRVALNHLSTYFNFLLFAPARLEALPSVKKHITPYSKFLSRPKLINLI